MINFYCSPEGTGDGLTVENPCDFPAARLLVRQNINTDNVCVYMMGGAYKLSETATFTSEDSGVNGFKTIWRSMSGHRPYFSGEGDSITGWTLFDAPKNIWRINIGAGRRFSALFVDGEKTQRAKHIFPSGAEGGADPGSRTVGYIDYSGVTIGPIAKPHKMEIFGHPHPWQVLKCRISSFAQGVDGDEYTLFTESELGPEYGAYELEEAYNTIGASFPYLMYWVENALEFLKADSYGHYFYDDDDGWLYYVPRQGEDITQVNAHIPKLATLIKSEENSGFKDVLFYGIGAKYTDWSEHLDMYYYQTDVACEFDDWRKWNILTDDGIVNVIPKAAIEFNHCENVHWLSAEISQLNSHGIHFNKGTRNCSILGSFFTKTGINPINVGFRVPGYYPEGSLQFFDYLDIPVEDRTSDTSILNNRIIGGELSTNKNWQSRSGVWSNSAERTKVNYNDVSDLPYCGIVISPRTGNYVDYIWNHEIGFNKIHDVMMLRRDGGGIYVGRTNTIGMRVHHNYLFNIANYPNGTLSFWEAHPIYCDDDSIGITVEKNVVLKNRVGGPKTWTIFKYQTSSDSSGWQTAPGLDVENPMILRDNYYSSGLIRAEFPGHDTSGASIIQNNLAIDELNPLSWPMEVHSIISGAGNQLLALFNFIDGITHLYGWKVAGEAVTLSATNGTIENYEDLGEMWRADISDYGDGTIVTAQSSGKTQQLTIGTITGQIIKKLDGTPAGLIKKLNGSPSGIIKRLVGGSWQ